MVQQVDATHAPADRAVCYTSVEELERVNQDLLKKVHELESVRDQRADAAASSEVTAVRAELNELKESRETQRSLLEVVTKQRDMYRVLLAQKDSKEAAKENGAESGVRAANEKLSAQLKTATTELEEEKKESRALREKKEELAGEVNALKRALSTEKLCNQQGKETIARLEQLVETMEEKTKKMGDEAMTIQQRLTDTQKELTSEKQKVGQRGGAEA